MSCDFFRKIYTAKVLPILTYGLPVTAPVCKQHWLVLEKVNRVAARLVLNNFADSYEELLLKPRWKTIAQLCVERQLLLQIKYHHSLRPYQWFNQFGVYDIVQYEQLPSFDGFCPANFRPPAPKACQFGKDPTPLRCLSLEPSAP